jgi:threonyl-tRNA synthetase
LKALLDEQDIRTAIDDRNEKAGRKIRDAEVNKVPFMVIVGEKEEENGTVSIREHGVGDKGSMTVADFVALLKERIAKELQ